MIENINKVPPTTFKVHTPQVGSWAKGNKIEILSSFSEEEKKGCSTSYVELVESLGSDLTVVNAARVSFGKEKTTVDEADKRLLKFLATHGHWTPYSQPQIQFRFRMPAFVARQYFKHTVGLTRNEISRRYVSTTPYLWIPKYFRESAPNVKQGSADTIHPENDLLIQMMYEQATSSVALFEEMVKMGVATEQARANLPIAFMVDFVETGSLAAYARICALREVKGGAQKEIEDFAKAILMHIKEIFPDSWNALQEAASQKD